ncbi:MULTISPECIES: fluoride efflux transporter FluC [Bacillaceae]|jgi:fluoride exporter|uniref:Fluoride-specific ion channel FluC n=1 Tax=Caldibacillus thermoamylovorans TaxID=35841 RepID=A0A090IUL0_9BACI|nr:MULTISPECIES: CrcB family protein [Bacillaceae]KIO63240.1 hypothetical protein B4065_3024 [Caldibacillus thermoamylovorans]KIO65862.1 hypothetical protein B4064_2431 [Caldibacillus thermoamylovorans]MDL0420049.1 CrcB family protein [Caldibacillus thermoamylovorans]PAC37361.1 CrcB family protein [Caldifermentibacillus hisashii]CEE01771.1 hypothetical protein BT1A1_1949 [Caldibacillus thermoamylovorans]
MEVLLIAIGGFFGAISRYYISEKWNRKFGFLPYGTLFVNLFGSFLLGLIIGFDTNQYIYSLLGIGFLGAFTTFSTFIVELIGLQEANKTKGMIVYLIISIIFGFVFALVGVIIGSRV